MMSMMSASFDSVRSLELSERLEQGVVEGGRVFDLWNMTEAGQRGQRRLRQQALDVIGLFKRCHRIFVAPQDRDRHPHARIGGAIGASRGAVGADEIVK